jgi:hypothetical protein
MLCVCAFVIFFSAVSGVIEHVVALCGASHRLSVLLLGFLEMTGGVSAASALPTHVAPIAAAAITGWSGLSVAFQLGGLCGDRDISLKPYFISKAFCALLNAATVALVLSLLGGIDSLGASTHASLFLPVGSALAPLWLSLFIGGCVAIRPRRRG